MDNETKKTTKADRRLQVYPPPKYLTLVKAYQKVNEMGESEVVTHVIRDFFDRMPPEERERIISLSKNSY